ncbi:MAG: hypothetical protein ACPIOQ_39170, partial [Promethearchaeia archaeon]
MSGHRCPSSGAAEPALVSFGHVGGTEVFRAQHSFSLQQPGPREELLANAEEIGDRSESRPAFV